MTLTDQEKEQLQRNAELPIMLEGQQLNLLSSHVIAEAIVKDHYILAEDSTCRVLMNVQLTESLLQEGQMRELIRFIQDSRKKWQLSVEQYISIAFRGSEEVLSIIQQHEALLQANVLVKSIHYGEERTEGRSAETELFDEKLMVLSPYKRNAQEKS